MKFFASLRESLGTDGMTVPAEEPVPFEALMAALAERLPASAYAALTAESVRVAVNQEFTLGSFEVRPGDEVAFMPPVTGG